MSGLADLPWKHLRPALWLLVPGVLAGSAAAAAGWALERAAAREFEAAEDRLKRTRSRHLDLVEERRQWAKLGPRYRAWEANGRIGEEQRGQWNAILTEAAAVASQASHRIGPPRTVHSEGPVTVRASAVAVELELAHEGRLLDFFRTLSRRARGTFTVSSCRLTRARVPDADDARAEGLRASCRMRWHTVVLSGMAPSPASSVDGTALDEFPRKDLPEPSLGRLFTTPSERERLDRLLSEIGQRKAMLPRIPSPPTDSPAPATWIHVDGIVLRSGRPVCAWIGGSRDCESPISTDAGDDPDRAPASVRLQVGGRIVQVLPGQSFHRTTGDLLDPLRQSLGPDGRAEFLRKSSRTALTPLSHTR